MRGFGGDAVGRRLRAVERLAWTDADSSSDTRFGLAHLHFDAGVGLFLSGGSDWCLDVDLTRAGDESWFLPYNYVDPAGRWTLRDASSEEPFSRLVGRRLESCAAIRNEVGELVGLVLTFEGQSIDLSVYEGELRT